LETALTLGAILHTSRGAALRLCARLLASLAPEIPFSLKRLTSNILEILLIAYSNAQLVNI
jgi:hypothetical protein